MGDNFNLIVIKAAQIGASPESLRDGLRFAAAVHSYPSKFQRCGFDLWMVASTYQSVEKEGRTFYKPNAFPDGKESPDSAIGEELAAELFRAFTGVEVELAEAAKVVGVGFLKSRLSFDPKKLVADPTPLVAPVGRLSILLAFLPFAMGTLVCVLIIVIQWAFSRR